MEHTKRHGKIMSKVTANEICEGALDNVFRGCGCLLKITPEHLVTQFVGKLKTVNDGISQRLEQIRI